MVLRVLRSAAAVKIDIAGIPSPLPAVVAGRQAARERNAVQSDDNLVVLILLMVGHVQSSIHYDPLACIYIYMHSETEQASGNMICRETEM